MVFNGILSSCPKADKVMVVKRQKINVIFLRLISKEYNEYNEYNADKYIYLKAQQNRFNKALTYFLQIAKN
jgi:hypothetical protein